MNISTGIRVVNSTLENSVAVRKLRVPHPSRVLCGRVGTRKACAKRIKFFRAEKLTHPPVFEKSFESAFYSRPGFRNLSNQWLAARQD
jgi:hypothetical protein